MRWILTGAATCALLITLALSNTRANQAFIDQRLASKTMLTPQMCLSFETFDANVGTCKPPCSFQAPCPLIERNYRRILNVLSLDDLKFYFAFDESPFQDAFGSSAEQRYQGDLTDPSMVANRTFTVLDGILGAQIAHVGNPVLARNAKQLWALLKVAIPSQEEKYIDQFLILHDVSGVIDASAWVTHDATTTWQIALNEGAAFAYDGSIIDRGMFIHTLVHEVGHLVTLNEDQVNPYVTSNSCVTLVLPEGCAQSNAYITAFAREFWPQEYGGEEVPSGVYVEGSFVSGYAADNPAEDMAESWTAFVLLPRPTGTTIAQKKILFFYNYPELVADRKEIRDGIGAIR